jgi:hypothetical protein
MKLCVSKYISELQNEWINKQEKKQLNNVQVTNKANDKWKNKLITT